MSQVLVFEQENSGELAELLEREGRIERNFRNAFYEAGLELRSIRDKRLYKVLREEPKRGRYSFATFEEYVEERWEIKRFRAFQIIEAADAMEKMSTMVDILPNRERHVRPLLSLETPEQQAEVWRRVISRHQTITAKLVTDEVEKRKAELAKDWLLLDEWNALSDDNKSERLRVSGDSKFNRQDTDSIEWALWSWNPVTGCLHGCDYCYARDIAHRFYPEQVAFNPAIYPSRLSAPKNTQRKGDTMGERNVFTCSMADLFGKWVPEEWIHAVLDAAADAPDWNFLFLTKFPQRLAEFEIPDNAWIGCTVDTQSRVATAQKAFSKVRAKVRFLSVEPMMEKITFSDLSMFDWIIMGGSSRSTQTEEFHPPFEWIVHLWSQAKKANLPVYMKTNLISDWPERVREYPEK